MGDVYTDVIEGYTIATIKVNWIRFLFTSIIFFQILANRLVHFRVDVGGERRGGGSPVCLSPAGSGEGIHQQDVWTLGECHGYVFFI